MPMFDDPKKELERLEEELLTEEFDDSELEGLNDLLKDYEEEDFGDCFREEPEEDDSFRRPGSPKDFSRAMSEMLQEDENENAFYDEDYKAGKQKKQKGIAGLVTLCVLETVAIVGLLLWWFLCLR